MSNIIISFLTVSLAKLLLPYDLMMVSSQLDFLTKLLASLTVVTVMVNVIVLLSPPLLPPIHPNQDEHANLFHRRQQLLDPLFHHSGDNVLSATTTKLRRQGNTTSIGGSIPSSPFTTQTWSEQEGRHYMMDIFQRAGISLTSDMASQLPTWSQVRQVVGDYPHVLNLPTSSTFRKAGTDVGIIGDVQHRNEFSHSFVKAKL